MKANKSIIITAVFTLLIILSCEDQNEMPVASGVTPSVSVGSNSKTSSRNGRAGTEIFDGLEGDPIDLEIAKKWASNYRATLAKPDEIVAHYFGSEIIQSILKESSCVGIRIYYALDDNGEKKLILVGVDSNGENLLPTAGAQLNEGNIAADYSYPCPTYCPGNGI